MKDHRATIERAAGLVAGGRAGDARRLLLGAMRSDAGNPHLMAMLASVLNRLEEYEPALYYTGRLLGGGIDDSNVYVTHAGALLGLGRHEEAIGALHRAVELDPHSVSARTNLASMLLLTHRPLELESVCRAGLDIHPGHVALSCDLAGALNATGRQEEAIEVLGRAIFAHPDSALEAVSLQCAAANNCPGIDPLRLRRLHENLGRLLLDRAPALPPPEITDPDPERRLRVGLVSSDLREHSVAYFVEPLLEHADASAVEYVAFSNHRKPDATAARLRARCAGWHDVFGVPAGGLAGLIRRERIDVAVDLNGNTLGNRLVDLAARPAPVQVTYLGYACTTGLAAFDARLVDSLTDPPGAEHHGTEPLVRLDPCFVCYRPPEAAPAPATTGEGPVVFGSFNALHKINAPSLELWARTMSLAPGSRLLLKCAGLQSEAMRGALRERFAAAGGDPGRLDFEPHTPTTAAHLAAYARVHVALDTTPYNGTTTTCEALWMGVPVVTLAGDRHAARVGASLLHAAGRAPWVTRTAAQFAEVAAGLAADRAALAAARADLRQTVRQSALCDGRRMAGRFEGALRNLWKARVERRAGSEGS